MWQGLWLSIETLQTQENSQRIKTLKLWCISQFLRTFQLLSPHLITHSGEKPYKCEECGKASSTKSYLYLQKLAHNEENIYKSKEPGKMANKFRDDQRIHSGKKSYKRGKNFWSSIAWYEHRIIPIGEKHHTCEECDKHYPTILSNKKIHTREKPYKYEDCGKALNYPSILSKHKNNSYRRESLQMWSMSQGLQLSIKTLQTKQNSYMGKTLQKPYKYEVCGLAFYCPYFLKRREFIQVRNPKLVMYQSSPSELPRFFLLIW